MSQMLASLVCCTTGVWLPALTCVWRCVMCSCASWSTMRIFPIRVAQALLILLCTTGETTTRAGMGAAPARARALATPGNHSPLGRRWARSEGGGVDQGVTVQAQRCPEAVSPRLFHCIRNRNPGFGWSFTLSTALSPSVPLPGKRYVCMQSVMHVCTIGRQKSRKCFPFSQDTCRWVPPNRAAGATGRRWRGRRRDRCI